MSLVPGDSFNRTANIDLPQVPSHVFCYELLNSFLELKDMVPYPFQLSPAGNYGLLELVLEAGIEGVGQCHRLWVGED
jgi:hypothetical protein